MISLHNEVDVILTPIGLGVLATWEQKHHGRNSVKIMNTKKQANNTYRFTILEVMRIFGKGYYWTKAHQYFVNDEIKLVETAQAAKSEPISTEKNDGDAG